MYWVKIFTYNKIFTAFSICLSYFRMSNLVKIECFTQDQEKSGKTIVNAILP